MRTSYTVLREIAEPVSAEKVNGTPIAEWQRIARSGATGDDARGDRGVYLIVNRGLSKARVGEGHIATRLRDHVRCFAFNENPTLRAIPPRWSHDPSLIDLIRETTADENRLFYVVLADGLGKKAAKAGQDALFDTFGIRRDGGWLINSWRR
jgi:hypothetical protein